MSTKSRGQATRSGVYGMMENSRTGRGSETWAVGSGALYGACPNVGRQVALLQGPLKPAIGRRVKMAMGVSNWRVGLGGARGCMAE
jgi:hypothetical protein